MARVVYSGRAREDILEIWVLLARNAGIPTADRVIDYFEGRVAALEDHPELGPSRPEIGEGARSLVCERWLVLYRIVDGEVQISRILDGTRDLGDIDWGRII